MSECKMTVCTTSAENKELQKQKANWVAIAKDLGGKLDSAEKMHIVLNVLHSSNCIGIKSDAETLEDIGAVLAKHKDQGE